MAHVQGHLIPHQDPHCQRDSGPASPGKCSTSLSARTRVLNVGCVQSGLNEVTISDLTSLADPDTICVAGTTNNRPARINDLTIDLVPNVHYSLYELSDLDDDTDEDEEDEEPESLKAAQEALRKIVWSLRDIEEQKTASEREIRLLDQVRCSVLSQ
jgi:hypothetical protein